MTICLKKRMKKYKDYIVMCAGNLGVSRWGEQSDAHDVEAKK
jgi:hypothetical protein